ncbi:MAG: phosphoribosylformylglycinamidine synthase subunit PurL [Cystobacterineae bacterium]|nr:phosphoribosylformylglycinamidine synthase subunit PurL [Cystobacterineae bacterium]
MKHSPQTLAQHGLTQEEYASIIQQIGREPNLLELGLFSVLWSEHCCYKSSKKLLKRFPTQAPQVLVGPGENAGVVSIGDGDAVAFKLESHNHPSYVEPFQGSATGVGGLVRDIFTMGATPIAAMSSLRFGTPEHPKTASLLKGSAAGMSFYANTMGLPCVGGELSFDASYNGNCLINAFVLGLLRADNIFKGTASGVGNALLYVGAKTGADGIHGATMASAEFGEKGAENTPTVQAGDPFVEKMLMEACLELFQTDALVGIQDMGAAGLTSSSIEMASRAGSGLVLELSQVPLRQPGMSAYEIMLSESQERMLMVAKQTHTTQVLEVCAKWGLEAAVVGHVTDSGRVVIREAGTVVADLPIAPLTTGAPLLERPTQRPSRLDTEWALPVDALPSKPVEQTLLGLLATPSIADKAWLYSQFDSGAGLGTVLDAGKADAALVRVRHASKGLAISIDCNARHVYADPFEGAQQAVAECTRNLACVGATPLGLSDCLNFGSPENPEIMWEISEAISGMAKACEALEVPVISGNVSLFNETDGKAIFPTPIVAAVGLVPDVAQTTGMAFKQEGDSLLWLGPITGALGASAWLQWTHAQSAGGKLAPLDWKLEKALQHVLRQAVREGLLSSTHDMAEGGFLVTLAECCVADKEKPLGARLQLPPQGKLSLTQLLFGEAPSRALVSCHPTKRAALEALCQSHALPCWHLGETTGQQLCIEGTLNLPIAQLSEAYNGGFAKALGI